MGNTDTLAKKNFAAKNVRGNISIWTLYRHKYLLNGDPFHLKKEKI